MPTGLAKQIAVHQLAVAFLVGILMHAWAVQVLFAKGEALLYRTPVIRSIYPALRDFLNYFSAESRREFDQVVVVTMGDSGMKVIGFVTQKDPKHLPEGFRDEDSILVYLPLSYMIGGYAVLMPKSAVQPIDMSMEDAMRFTLTAGVTGATRAGSSSTERVPAIVLARASIRSFRSSLREGTNCPTTA